MLSKTHSKYIQSLHHKKLRDEENVFIAEGGKVVMELITSAQFECVEILALTNWLQENSLFLQKNFFNTITELQPHELDKISALTTPNQVLAIFKKRMATTFDSSGKISLLLDGIQDPGNMGTIIRIADWFGIGNIVCSVNCADMYNPKVVQSTMGSLGRVNVIYTNIISWLAHNKKVTVYAAALHGKPLQQFKQLKEGLIVIGNESKGISDEVMKYCDEKITIAKTGAAESLNAAVATGIILSHVI